MNEQRDAQTGTAYSNVNLKITEEEWAFKNWCIHQRITQVDMYREHFALLKENMLGKIEREPS